MGNLILCVGKRAERPFVFRDTGTWVFTLEEMCYYIYHSIDTISLDIFNEDMVNWLKEQPELLELSRKMERLIANHNSLKDRVVTLLCGCDYYRESEIRRLIGRMDQLENMSPFQRFTRRGSSLLEEGKYKEAELFLLELLKSETARQFTAEEYGDILHNLAVIHIHTASYGEAAREFKDAYERNHRRETLRQYLFALRLSEQKELYEKERIRLEVDEELLEEIQKEFDGKLEEARNLPEYRQLKELIAMKEQGQVSAYYEAIDGMIEKWKQEYKEEVVG